LWALGDSPFNHALQRAEERQTFCVRDRCIAEAGCGALVAHRTERPRGNQKGIAVAVGANLIELQKMTGRLALFPQALFAAAEENDMTALQRFAHRVAIHVPNHQYGTRVSVLDDSRQKALALGEIQRAYVCWPERLARVHDCSSAAGGRTAIPAARKSRLRAVIAIAPL